MHMDRKQRAGGGENGGSLFHGDRVSAREDERMLAVDAGDDRTIMRMDLMPQNRTLKNGYHGKFYVVLFFR